LKPFRIFNTPVKINIRVLPILLLVWGGVTWFGISQHPGRAFWQGLLIGLVSSILLWAADLGHALAHIFSARQAGAPMDELLITSDMPRTLYQNNDVTPNTHRLRALGGPIFNLAGFLISLAIFAISPGGSILREWMAWSAGGHGLLFIMSLAPLPPVDGGTILKWTLVQRGRTESEADKLVRQMDWGLGIIIVITGIVLIFMRIWIIGLILLGVGGIIFGIAAGKIR
jgi:hypothetical protein